MEEDTQARHQALLETPLTSLKEVWYILLSFSFVSNLLILALSLYSLQVLDRVMSSGSLATLMLLTLITLAAIIGHSLLQTIRSQLLIRVSAWLDIQISKPLLETLLINPNIAFGSATQALREFSNIKQFLTGTAIQSLADTPWSLIFIATLFLLHPYLGVLTLLSGFVLVFLGFWNDHATREPLKAANQVHQQSMSFLERASQNQDAMNAMGMLDAILGRWEKPYQYALYKQEVASQEGARISELARFVRYLVQILVTCVGAILVLQHIISPGAMIAASILASKALQPFDATITNWKLAQQAKQSYQSLRTLLDKIPEKSESMPLPKPLGKLSIERVSYQVGDRQVLKHIDFEIRPGEWIALIGPSGSGKSTLSKIMAGIIPPNEGCMRLDGADVFLWQKSLLGSYIGFVPQHVDIFPADIKSNIARMSEYPDPKKVVMAAKIAGVHDMILNLKNGYETDLTEKNILSSGQRQRIALARAFYNNPQILILDEPNAHLDLFGDNALLKALQYAKQQKKTIVIVTHKPAILRSVDRIAWIQDGALVAYDDREPMLQKIQQGYAGQTPS